jgi:hypothetical protein
MSLGKPIATSTLDASNIEYGLRFTLSPGQKITTLEEPVLKIRREKTESEKAVEVTVAGNGKKYSSSFPQRERFISFNDMALTLREVPEGIRHWRILLDNDNLTEFEGIKNRDIVALQPEKPPMDVENAPDLLHPLVAYVLLLLVFRIKRNLFLERREQGMKHGLSIEYGWVHHHLYNGR